MEIPGVNEKLCGIFRGDQEKNMGLYRGLGIRP